MQRQQLEHHRRRTTPALLRPAMWLSRWAGPARRSLRNCAAKNEARMKPMNKNNGNGGVNWRGVIVNRNLFAILGAISFMCAEFRVAGTDVKTFVRIPYEHG